MSGTADTMFTSRQSEICTDKDVPKICLDGRHDGIKEMTWEDVVS
jgi:hypothetical protein